MSNEHEIINGIKCNVESCVYHATGDECHAGAIHVGGDCHACHCSETACNTFQSKA